MSRHSRDYIEKKIAMVRNHRDADNAWPQWANIFADEIEDCWAEVARLQRIEEAAREYVDYEIADTVAVRALDDAEDIHAPNLQKLARIKADAAFGILCAALGAVEQTGEAQ